MLERETVDTLAREIIGLTHRLRPLLAHVGAEAWPGRRGPDATELALDLAAAVQALDAAVEALYLQTDSLEGAYLALEVERRANRELFEAGPDGYLVTDPDGLVVRANSRAGGLFGCAAEELVGHSLPAMMVPDDRASLAAAIQGFELADWEAEWIGEALRASGPTFRVALAAAAVRHSDRSVYRIQWSVRDIGRRPGPD